MQLRVCLLLFLLCGDINLFAQSNFVTNKGQWNEHVLYQADIKSGRAFLCADRIRFSLYDVAAVAAVHEEREKLIQGDDTASIDNSRIRCYAYDLTFVNANQPSVCGSEKQKTTFSYFLGSDPRMWKGNIPAFSKVEYDDLYDGIDLLFSLNDNRLKYDFVVEPGTDPQTIKMNYSGQQSLSLVNGNLEIGAGFTVVREVIPEAYQIINGRKHIIRCEYVLNGSTVSFYFPEGYNMQYELVIDPEVVASTYSGGPAMSFGHTATYDDDANLYSGGIVFGQGFPVTLGAFDVLYDSVWDIGICKFDPAGSSVLSCTFIGGDLEENPMSMYYYGDKLYVYGRTKSSDFPVTANAFDQSFAGMNDIVVFCLNADFSTLISSTFIGGTGDDGVNFNALVFYDGYRGEIVVGADGTVYVVSGSNSSSFPVTPGAYSTSYSGGVDVVVFRMDALLSTMIWSTFLGAGQNDGGMGIRVDASGYVYVTGTARNIFGGWPTVAGGYQSVYGGGAADAFLAKFDPTGSALVAFTFFGGSGYDFGYFVDLDSDGNVYLLSTYAGAPVTSGVYSNAGSENCIASFDAGLSTLRFSTVVGDGTSTGRIIPSAFMVDHCKRIYIGGFGGSQNWPRTDDALPYNWSIHNQWYLGALSENATDLLFGSFYGSWHVDGGSSRFDPKGVVYQSVCADSAEFPVTSWAYADGTTTDRWNMCAFKIDFQIERDTANLPNIFTPNNDGINDVYDVGLRSVNFYEVKIFDRWGVEVFTTDTIGEMWDGQFNDRECPNGVYYVICRHGYCAEEPYITTGFFHLQR